MSENVTLINEKHGIVELKRKAGQVKTNELRSALLKNSQRAFGSSKDPSQTGYKNFPP